ncbi:LLM class flavin-dependent oxidoreductase [Georgenia thermotolerans]|uniref:MsnO8 family LLM class oxidoreductase n=1 Tax=Georgenia thermotolerans TaxID=527326 RepID=A0A7J5UQB8_9MICO|nr:LLM class flavin-dependent oxidoreductase [Georgenia thermotolerans]KAE8764410.1 MsnO8 family LLM class oxidoreductase [Georgenia thermotolerans]
MPVPLSILDLATVAPDGSVADTFAASVDLAQHAERWGYTRYWFAEHHNMPSIASSATSVLIGHIAGATSTIRVGAGGIMLPNHSPLVIAEQFGTLATLYPGRIDLGLGRAPGGDPNVMVALRRDRAAAERFPQDVVELQALLGDSAPHQLVRAIPGEGTRVPLIILGSSLFGAKLAAALGLPYSFASHFAPAALEDAVRAYRREYQPSAEHPEPYVIAAMNVFAADTDGAARAVYEETLRQRVVGLVRPGVSVSPDDADALLASPAGQQVRQMLRYSAVGTAETVREQVADFARHADADELIVATSAAPAERLRSYELLAQAWGLAG